MYVSIRKTNIPEIVHVDFNLKNHMLATVSNFLSPCCREKLIETLKDFIRITLFIYFEIRFRFLLLLHSIFFPALFPILFLRIYIYVIRLLAHEFYELIIFWRLIRLSLLIMLESITYTHYLTRRRYLLVLGPSYIFAFGFQLRLVNRSTQPVESYFVTELALSSRMFVGWVRAFVKRLLFQRVLTLAIAGMAIHLRHLLLGVDFWCGLWMKIKTGIVLLGE